MKGKPYSLNILVTAGPTQEPIDPVRFISNRSTGTMGFSIAQAAKKRWHKVILISGPTVLPKPKGIEFFSVETAQQMRTQILKNTSKADVIVMAAAVSDYRPRHIAAQKIKKNKPTLNLGLIKNNDILKELGRVKKNKILVGFALETEHLYKNAVKKLKEKRLDIIIANKLSKKQNIFGKNKTSVLIIDKDGNKEYLYDTKKEKIAEEIVRKIEDLKIKQN